RQYGQRHRRRELRRGIRIGRSRPVRKQLDHQPVGLAEHGAVAGRHLGGDEHLPRSTPVMRPRAVSGSSMGVGHGAFHALIRSSVVVMVARSDRVLLMMASPYSAGMPAT